jgi:DNA (cytosine-5)-methyltransferase 1
MTMKAVELFAGAGGLAMGVGLAGFKSLAVVEWDRWACDTIRENARRGFPLVNTWPLLEGDVREVDWAALGDGIELVAGGPPCQPFSMGGKHQAHDDVRDMFPAAVDVVRQLRPKAFIIENVKGLTRSSFANYYQYILLQLEFPELPRRKSEAWFDHLMRLQTEKSSGKLLGKTLSYNVIPTLVNAADYGVPQKRERVFIVGFRRDLGIEWSFPAVTHSEDALLFDQWVSGDYWKRHEIAPSQTPKMPDRLAEKVNELRQFDLLSRLSPWRTVRDAIADLPDPEAHSELIVADHKFQAGARSYPGHTGSPLDQPAKTIKAGDHGVPGGENMIVKLDGSVRYLTARETARVQTFPDGYIFHGSWSETMRQLGNAVPVALARIVASSVAQAILGKEIAKVAASSNAMRRAA